MTNSHWYQNHSNENRWMEVARLGTDQEWMAVVVVVAADESG
jgi:hypothetical protein